MRSHTKHNYVIPFCRGIGDILRVYMSGFAASYFQLDVLEKNTIIKNGGKQPKSETVEKGIIIMNRSIQRERKSEKEYVYSPILSNPF